VEALRIRQGARALLLTPDRHVLLCRFDFDDATVWALPGGGLEHGEDHVTALRRELDEELGLDDVTIGPQVWFREHLIAFTSGLWDGQREQVYRVDVAERFEPRPRLTWEELHAEHLHELRWWHLDELDAVDDPRVLFAPRQLASLLRRFVTDGFPPEPIDSGV
jgi:8-oxo-dGTP diphosphatase